MRVGWVVASLRHQFQRLGVLVPSVGRDLNYYRNQAVRGAPIPPLFDLNHAHDIGAKQALQAQTPAPEGSVTSSPCCSFGGKR